MPKDKEKTIVILRRFKNERHGVLALFPCILATNDGFLCSSYVHVGQHGSADYQHCLATTTPIARNSPDALALIRELRRVGYNLDIRTRAPSDAYDQRKKALQ